MGTTAQIAVMGVVAIFFSLMLAVALTAIVFCNSKVAFFGFLPISKL